VQRILSREETNPGLKTFSALAHELGVSISLQHEMAASEILRKQAERKAKRILALVHGNAALEAQTASSQTMRDLREITIQELLAGSRRRLWAD
jgi:hypothetical protein